MAFCFIVSSSQSWYFEGKAAKEIFRQEQREQEDREKKRAEKDKPFGLLARMKATGWEPGQQLPAVDAIEADHTIEAFTIPIAKPLEWLVKPLLGVVRASWLGRVGVKEAAGARFSVNPSKFDYFFGRVVSGSEHNIARSIQNLEDLTTLGIKSESQLMKVFEKALESGTVISTKTSQYGTTVMKSVNIRNQGSINVGFFYQGGNMSTTPSVSSIIPKIFK